MAMTREETRIYWTDRYDAAKDWNDPHWEASERKEHKRYVEALKIAIEALTIVQNMHNTINRDGMDMGQAIEYCKDCVHDEVCRYYPYDGCAFKETYGPN